MNLSLPALPIASDAKIQLFLEIKSFPYITAYKTIDNGFWPSGTSLRPVEEVPQLLCTYEEILDAYHAGLQVPEDVTLLWSDDKHGYTRNLCNPEEMKRSGGGLQ